MPPLRASPTFAHYSLGIRVGATAHLVLAAAIRLCNEASLQALFIGNNLATAESNGFSLVDGQIGLLDMVSPDQFARLVARQSNARKLVMP